MWEPKLKKWDSYFQEQEQADSGSDSEGSKGEDPTKAIDSVAVHRKDENQGYEDSGQQSSSNSGSAKSNSRSGSESDADNDEGTRNEAIVPKDVHRLGSSNTTDAKNKKDPKAAQISTDEVTERELETAEEGRSSENKTVGKTSSTAAVKEHSVSNIAKVTEKAPVTKQLSRTSICIAEKSTVPGTAGKVNVPDH